MTGRIFGVILLPIGVHCAGIGFHHFAAAIVYFIPSRYQLCVPNPSFPPVRTVLTTQKVGLQSWLKLPHATAVCTLQLLKLLLSMVDFFREIRQAIMDSGLHRAREAVETGTPSSPWPPWAHKKGNT